MSLTYQSPAESPSQILCRWSASRLRFYLELKGVPLPRTYSKADLVRLAESSISLEFILPRRHFTSSILRNLEYGQLIHFCTKLRGYVVLSTARPLISLPPGKARQKYNDLVRLASELDYNTMVRTEEDRVQYDHDILAALQYTVTYTDPPPKDFSFFNFYYRNEDIDIVLDIYGIDKADMSAESARSLAQASAMLFSAGKV
ncbi:hypothetical protein V1520DRAFT_53346 [Lipomyces starkeyi]|uniref:Uncharacterized protein n=1 Tax=Lipomyces starkeyi NRRL Y-11557 TaxID=675824 RepID=A0A1E3QCA5_LIPST|nr:hypothetical protein LIPSTDRAFT_782 [Lipomyces starkeyi NRRL Y-11557]